MYKMNALSLFTKQIKTSVNLSKHQKASAGEGLQGFKRSDV
tara:strand:+ start:180 stop:302 length:123 start_codon:yes stop_codon:yes gene_type:complete